MYQKLHILKLLVFVYGIRVELVAERGSIVPVDSTDLTVLALRQSRVLRGDVITQFLQGSRIDGGP
jgi:hypothetical protein